MTNDFLAGLGHVLQVAEEGNTLTVGDNPESYLTLAVASYIYRNPPKAPEGEPEKPAIIYVADRPWDEETVFKKK